MNVALFEQEIGKKGIYSSLNQAIKTSFWLQVILFLFGNANLVICGPYIAVGAIKFI